MRRQITSRIPLTEEQLAANKAAVEAAQRQADAINAAAMAARRSREIGEKKLALMEATGLKEEQLRAIQAWLKEIS